MADEKGIKETSELLIAMGDLAVVAYKAHKALDPTRPVGEQVQAFAQALAAQIMTNPDVIADVKAAFDGIGEVPSELKDLDFSEAMQVVAVAGQQAAKAAAAVKG